MRHLAKIHLLLRGIALALILMVTVDYVSAVDIPVEKARLSRTDSEEQLKISLPFSTPDGGYQYGYSYHFHFNYRPGWIAGWRPYMFGTNGCVDRVIVNGMAFDGISGRACDRVMRGIWLKPGRVYHMEAILSSGGANSIAMQFSYQTRLNYEQRATCLLAALYLLALSAIRTAGEWKRFHRNLLMVLLFIGMSLFPALEYRNSRAFSLATLAITYAGFIGMFTLVASGCLWSVTRRLYGWLGMLVARVGEMPPRIVVTGAALVFAAITISMAWFIFGGVPHVADTHAQYVHAKILNTGRYAIDSHPLKAFFDFQVMTNNGRYFSPYPPVHVVLLAIMQRLHAPWLLNPLIGSVTVAVIYLLARELADRRAGYIAALLTLTSPFILFMSGEYMNHVTALLMQTWAIYLYIRWLKTGKVSYVLLFAGAFVLAVLTRPQSVLPFLLPVCLHGIWHLSRNPTHLKAILRHRATYVAGLLMVLILFFIFRSDLKAPFLHCYAALRPYFYMDRWMKINRDVMRSLYHMYYFNDYLLGWPSASLLGVWLMCLLRTVPRYAGLVLACCIVQALVMVINKYDSMVLGPRYMYETSGCLIALTAVFLYQCPALIGRYVTLPAQYIRGAVTVAVLAMTGVALSSTDAALYRQFRQDYWEGNANYAHMVVNNTRKPALVFAKRYVDFRLLYFLLPPWDSNPVIVAKDLGDEANAKLLEFYPERHAYLLDGVDLQSYDGESGLSVQQE